jgi:cytochrome oxidase Cu insertion factor (SCO1/SenC/PrrC family)
MRNSHAFPRLLAATALAALFTVAGAAASRAAMPADGSPAPAVPTLQSVLAGNYEPFDLKAASTGKTIVLYFFPQAFTEG